MKRSRTTDTSLPWYRYRTVALLRKTEKPCNLPCDCDIPEFHEDEIFKNGLQGLDTDTEFVHAKNNENNGGNEDARQVV